MSAKLNIQSKHKENRLFCTRFIRFLIALAAMTVSTTSAWGETKSIKYLDYDPYYNTFSGASHDATKITSSSTNVSLSDDSDDWYYVEGNVTISGEVTLTNYTYLILCDDATLTINPSSGDGINMDQYYLTIYAQSSGSHKGKLIINTSSTGIDGNRDVTINGGDISVTSTYCGIECNSFALNGGTLTVNASHSSSYGIYADSYVTINGGKLSAIGGTAGIRAKGSYSIKLGWTNATDFIKASSYDGTVNTISGKSFNIEGGGTIEGNTTLTDAQKADIANKKLTPNTTASHTITLGTGITGGTIEVDKTKAFKNERVAITATPETGKMLTSLSYTYGSTTVNILTSKEANDYVFTMPDADVTSINATFATPVASITSGSTTTKYANITDAMTAVNAAASDVTMTLCKDITDIDNTNFLIINNGNTVTEGSVTRPVEITLDLNGHKLSSTTYDVIWLEGGALTIMDSGTGGEISATGNNAIGIYHNGKLTINGGTIASINKTAINNDDISSTPGLITINGGTINANGDNISGIDNNGTLTINGGTITAIGNNSRGIYEYKGTLTVNGGIISATGSGSRGIYSEGSSESHATITIKGGTISGQENGIFIILSNLYSYVDVAISGGTIKSNADGIRTELYTTLTLSALPTFDCNTDISLGSGRIIFDTDITSAPERKIKVSFGSALPRTLTSGYGAHVKDANGNVIDPGKFFTIQKDFAKGSARLTGEGDGAEAEAYYPTVKVAYVDADGNLHDDADGSTASTADDMATAYILGGMEKKLGTAGTDADHITDTWYVCQTLATENGCMGLVYDRDQEGNGNALTLANYCNVHLILADDCLMTVNGGEAIGNGIRGGYGSSLTIYGQGGTDATGQSTEGALSVTAKDYGIWVDNSLTINGGQISASCTNVNALTAANGNLTINGGQVTAVSPTTAICANAGNITLGWTAAGDYIKSDSYAASGTVSIPAGKYLFDGTNVYGDADNAYQFGAGTNAAVSAIAGKKLLPTKPITGVTAPYAVMKRDDASWIPVGGTKAYLPKSYTEGDGEVTLSELKGVPKGKPVILGNATDGESLTGPFFLVPAPETSTDASEVTAESIQADYEAKVAAMDNHFALTDGTKKLSKVIEDAGVTASEAIVMVLSGGKFRSVYIADGDFDKLTKDGLLLFILSKWDYMHVNSNGSSGGGSGARSIGIDSGNTTGIINHELHELNSAWYDMQGRRIQQPGKKGLYIKNGKKVIIN